MAPAPWPDGLAELLNQLSRLSSIDQNTTQEAEALPGREEATGPSGHSRAEKWILDSLLNADLIMLTREEPVNFYRPRFCRQTVYRRVPDGHRITN